MRYLTEINAFERLMDRRPLPLAIRGLWYTLMREANRRRWPDTMQLDNEYLLGITGLSKPTLITMRKALSDAGLLEFSQGVKGQPSTYRLIPPSLVELQEAHGGASGLPYEEGNEYLEDVEAPERYFGWTEAAGRELAKITRDLFAAYWPGRSPDDRDRQRVFFYIKDQQMDEDGEWTMSFPEERKALLAYAFEAASRAGAVNWNYIAGVYRNLGARGIKTVEQAHEYDEKRSSQYR
ncbi:DnaD domain protein [Muriventricola aceti]|uniref:DnaD domain protein n=1 Tax=Muriventricola aceti TaxID=2981773 RepID=UPI00082289D6|nr:DnaD domain protein [Muriventricola aceti]MCU6701292.1 DnaD domain protein [Muriventricola aceti]SCI56711.1 Uncharacterised protein [uncultured Flavonifractor sp.]